MNRARTSPNRLDVWGDSMLNKLPSRSRKNRKRSASKKRRVGLRSELAEELEGSEELAGRKRGP